MCRQGPWQCVGQLGLGRMCMEGKLGRGRVPCYELRDSKFKPGLPIIINNIYQGRSIEHILFNSLLD